MPTPNIDRMPDENMMFFSFYVQAAVIRDKQRKTLRLNWQCPYCPFGQACHAQAAWMSQAKPAP
jgi:hypothetical protein